MATSANLRVAVVQFSPTLGKVEENVKKAEKICSKIQPDTVDLVCLPEMIMTGYVFPDASAISPYLEQPQTGATSRFCADLARRLRCYVTAGYPEALKPEEYGRIENGSGMVGANSAALFSPDGTYVGGYRKTNLFMTDKTWAKPGDGFKTFNLPALPKELQTLSIGICMDLNPHPPADWTLAGGPYEIADYCRLSGPVSGFGYKGESKRRTNVLVLLNAWLDSQTEMETKWDASTLNYWIARLRPLWDREHDISRDDEESDDHMVDSHEKETIVIICNRSGDDNGTLFAGTSAVLRLREGSGDPEVVGIMGRREEGVRIWSV